MKILRFINLLFIVLLSISILQCSDDKSSDDVNLADFSITGVECTTDVYLGHPVKVAVTITSADVRENVPVNFYLGKDTDVQDAEIPMYSAGSYIIPTVSSGTNRYEILISVPAHSIDAGEYNLAAMLDPAATISREKDECQISGDQAVDSVKECYNESTLTVVNVKLDYINSPDLLIEDINLTSDVATVITGDSNPDFITGTVKIKSVAKGMINVPVRFILEKDGVEYTMMIWDTDIEGYSDDYLIGELKNSVTKSIPFSLRIDSTLTDNLSNGENPMTLKAVVDPDDLITEAYIEGLSGGETNNSLTKQITIVKDAAAKIVPITVNDQKAPGTGLHFDKSYSMSFGSGLFGAFPNFSSSASLDENGAAGYSGGGINISIFNQSFSFVWLEASAAALPHKLSSSFVDIYIRFATEVLYSYHVDGEFSWDKDWTVYKSKGYTATFWAGWIPVNVEAGAQGTMGFKVTFEVGDNLEATASEFANAGAYASASVGIAGIFEGGVKCNLSLVNIEYKAIVNAGMELSEGAQQIRGVLHEEINCVLAGPSGSLNFFIKYPFIPMCRGKIFGRKFWYPCGRPRIQEDQYPIVSFTIWSMTVPILDLTQELPWINTGL